MKFEEQFTALINTINGDKQNLLEYHALQGKWSFQAVNNGVCPLGEVCGEIDFSANNLDEVLTTLKIEIAKYNKEQEL